MKSYECHQILKGNLQNLKYLAMRYLMGGSVEHMVDLADRLSAFPSLTEVVFILDCNSENGAEG